VNPTNSAKQADGLIDFIKGKLKGELGYTKISIIGENAKWVQDIVPALKKGAEDAGLQVPVAEFFDVQTADFSPIFTKVKDSGSQYLMIILSHAASDVFVKQWYDAKVPVPIGGIDVKGQDADFFNRVGGKAISEVSTNFVLRAPITDKTVAWWDKFVKTYNRSPVYTAGGAYDAVYIYANAVSMRTPLLRRERPTPTRSSRRSRKPTMSACAAVCNSTSSTRSRTARVT